MRLDNGVLIRWVNKLANRLAAWFRSHTEPWPVVPILVRHVDNLSYSLAQDVNASDDAVYLPNLTSLVLT
ncbi:hypothetical protein E2C01_073676 [Portunus trituberculatus]|uniref:Uncharacterized protein n=1 Tax=Portunus trituberculatus TaxID=210409 RepID=A0A5B7IA24_PORTR|nr:hypothetical protein [Portunus trituberculatus]